MSHTFTATNNKTDNITLNYIYESLKLRLPRCSICSSDWYGKKSTRRNKEEIETQKIHHTATPLTATTNKSQRTSVHTPTTPPHTNHTASNKNTNELILLPSCKCTHLKMVSQSPFSSSFSTFQSSRPFSSYSDHDFLCAFQEALSSSQRHKGRQGTYDSPLHQQEDQDQDILQQTLTMMKIPSFFSSSCISSPIRILSHNTMCRSCLQRFVEASQQVEKQEETSAVFTTQLQCPNCRHKYSPRALSNLLKDDTNDPRNMNNRSSSYRVSPIVLVPQTIPASATSANTSNIKHYFKESKQHSSSTTITTSFAQYLTCTIETIRFWKRIRKLTLEHWYKTHHTSRNQTSALLLQNTKKTMTHYKNVKDSSCTTEIEKDDNNDNDHHSSDSCFSCHDEDKDHDSYLMTSHDILITSIKKQHHHVEMKPGELREELLRKDPKYRQEVENEELLLSMTCEELGLIMDERDITKSMTYGEYLQHQAQIEEQKRVQIQQDSIMIQNQFITTNQEQQPIITTTTAAATTTTRREKSSRRIMDITKDSFANGEEINDPSIVEKKQKSIHVMDIKKHPFVPASKDHTPSTSTRKKMDTPSLTPMKNGTKMVGIHNHNSTKKKKYSQSTLPLEEEKKEEKILTTPRSTYPTDIPSDERELESLQIMLDMGFPEIHSKRTLRDANYNVELAVSMIMSLEQSEEPYKETRNNNLGRKRVTKNM